MYLIYNLYQIHQFMLIHICLYFETDGVY